MVQHRPGQSALFDEHKTKFFRERADYANPRWEQFCKRENELYSRKKILRSPFYRDYTRILHSTAYRRLKHKTQIFFATENDHICTRIEHAGHVASVSYTISKQLGLDTELTSAIAIGHDLGHTPFGHQGEIVLRSLVRAKIDEDFWHERNSLRFVDVIETLPDPEGYDNNLTLTYAVRDGIITHCGEIDENGLRPRLEAIELGTILRPNQVFPYSWEGCVVKIADKIAYMGRDIEDAITLKIITLSDAKNFLRRLVSRPTSKLERRKMGYGSFRDELNNTVIMDELVSDLVENSNLKDGLLFSYPYFSLIKEIKSFSCERIYNHPRLSYFKRYADLIIGSLFEALMGYYAQGETKEKLDRDSRLYPNLISYFSDWLIKYSGSYQEERAKRKHKNRIIYDLGSERDYLMAITDFISGMTDKFAIRCFRELTTF